MFGMTSERVPKAISGDCDRFVFDPDNKRNTLFARYNFRELIVYNEMLGKHISRSRFFILVLGDVVRRPLYQETSLEKLVQSRMSNE